MMTPLKSNHHPYGCEITLPIVLKLRIYLEPEIVEASPACHMQKSEPKLERVSGRWRNLFSVIGLRLGLFTLALLGVLSLH